MEQDSTFWVAVLAMVGAVAGPMLTYKLAVRHSAGRVATSDADGLWKAYGELVRTYQTDIASHQQQLTGLREELDATRVELADARREHAAERNELLGEIQRLRSDLRDRDSRIGTLEADRTALQKRVAELENELKGRLEAARSAASTLGNVGGTG